MDQQDPGTLETGGVRAVDVGRLVESVVKPVQEVLERSSLTPASVDADVPSSSSSLQAGSSTSTNADLDRILRIRGRVVALLEVLARRPRPVRRARRQQETVFHHLDGDAITILSRAISPRSRTTFSRMRSAMLPSSLPLRSTRSTGDGSRRHHWASEDGQSLR